MRVRMISSPGEKRLARVRDMAKVRVVMFWPKMISRGSAALKKSTRAARVCSTASVETRETGKRPPKLALASIRAEVMRLMTRVLRLGAAAPSRRRWCWMWGSQLEALASVSEKTCELVVFGKVAGSDQFWRRACSGSTRVARTAGSQQARRRDEARLRQRPVRECIGSAGALERLSSRRAVMADRISPAQMPTRVDSLRLDRLPDGRHQCAGLPMAMPISDFAGAGCLTW